MIRIFALLFAAACLALAFVAGARYEGQWLVYALFTLTANALLFNGFHKKAIFFDTFIGVFLWLGFWLKLSLRVAFASGQFHEPVGLFDGSAHAFDHALLVATCGLAGFLVASLVRQRFFVYADTPSSCASQGLFQLYKAYRKPFITLFLLLVLAVAISNVVLGIYQRGMVTQTFLPLGLNGVYKWLLQFGMASIAAMIIRFEIELTRTISWWAIVLPLVESFFSNVSLLSRGMVLNATALGFGGLRTLNVLKLRIEPKRFAAAAVVFSVLFIASVVAVNYLRASSVLRSFAIQASAAQINASGSKPAVVTVDTAIAAKNAQDMTTPLFIDRWVGIEGVMAVSMSDRVGWSLWKEAWKEKFQEGTLTLYDRYFIESPYALPGIDNTKHHFVSLPGVIAFFFYPGSFKFLFFGLLAMGLAAALLEWATYRLTGQNWILCSLFAQVIAFRYASFGYVPSQSYLLFGTLVLNILIIACADWMFRRWLALRQARP